LPEVETMLRDCRNRRQPVAGVERLRAAAADLDRTMAISRRLAGRRIDEVSRLESGSCCGWKAASD
jgi:hypothetical protein